MASSLPASVSRPPPQKVLGFMPALYGFGLTLGPILGGVVSKYGGPRMAFGAGEKQPTNWY